MLKMGGFMHNAVFQGDRFREGRREERVDKQRK
jgi:hypothetical protein